MEIIVSIVSGIISSIIIGQYILYRDERRWKKTKQFFVSKISGKPYLASYAILSVLKIDPIDYDDTMRTNEDITEEIFAREITSKQYEQLAFSFKAIINDIEIMRAQALALPTFKPDDFHKVDKNLELLRTFTRNAHFFLPIEEEDPEKLELNDSLKKALVALL